MTSTSDDFSDLALELLSEEGILTTVTGVREGVYDPSISRAPIVNVTFDCYAIKFPYDEINIDGTNILDQDSQVYAKFIGDYAPRPDDRFQWNGNNLAIVKVRPISPVGQDIVHVLQVRG